MARTQRKRRTGKNCGRCWTPEENEALANWSAAGCDADALLLLAQTINRTVRAVQEQARKRGLWKSKQGWEPHEIAQIVAWARSHGTSGEAIATGLKELSLDRTVGSARYYLYREGVILRGGQPAGEVSSLPEPGEVQDPEALLPADLQIVYWRLLKGQREVADSIATYDIPAFIRYVRAAQFWNECPESFWTQDRRFVPQARVARGHYAARVSDVQAKTKGGV